MAKDYVRMKTKVSPFIKDGEEGKEKRVRQLAVPFRDLDVNSREAPMRIDHVRDMARNWTPEVKEEFLLKVSTNGAMVRAAKEVGIKYRTLSAMRANDPELAFEIRSAVDAYRESLETEAWRRAVHGVDEPVFYKGKQITTVKRYSDTLLVKLLEAELPEKYRPQLRVSTNEDADGAPQPSPLDTARRIAFLLARASTEVPAGVPAEVPAEVPAPRPGQLIEDMLS